MYSSVLISAKATVIELSEETGHYMKFEDTRLILQKTLLWMITKIENAELIKTPPLVL